MSEIARMLAARFSGPLLFDYVWWILREAEQKGLRRLYFLARDGYLLREIAERFCEAFSLPIECRYLYCSRAALRMPSYHLIGDEADALLFQYGYRVTLRSVMERCGFRPEQARRICAECGLETWNPERMLTAPELLSLRETLAGCGAFRALLTENSKAAYRPAMEYLRREGLFSGETVAVVDSGWTGSMQRSLRQLLQSGGFQGNLIGFYFGLYAAPKPEDGEYKTWYFNRDGRAVDKMFFSNNLFECLLSAPHGMTVSYAERDGGCFPVLQDGPGPEEVRKMEGQISAVLEYVRRRLPEIRFGDLDIRKQKRLAARNIYRYMARPTREEAAYYGGFRFCDDVTESYRLRLAAPEQTEALNGYLLPVRIARRLFRLPPRFPELLWPYGTIAFLRPWRQICCRWSVYAWQWLKYIRKKS